MKLYTVIAALIIVVSTAAVVFIKRMRAARLAREKATQERQKAAGESAELVSFMQAAIAADQAWMRANDQAQAEALRRGDKAEWKRLFDEKGQRLSDAKGNMVDYLKMYYPFCAR